MYAPFTLNISPMERLFLINFEKDPDDLYIGFEPQWFDDVVYGTGLRIIAWRKDGYIDVYQQPGLTREEKIDVAAKGLADTIIRPMTHARFNVTTSGVDVAFAFEDKAGRKVAVEIVEKSRKPTRPFSLLAPVGSSSANPSSLPVYLMFKFDFVRRANTDVTISIDGRMHQADTFPFPLNGSRVYFMRYSAETFLVDWCPAQSQALAPLSGEGNKLHGPDDTLYELSGQQDCPAFTRIRSSRKSHHFAAEFHPPFPEITHIADNNSFSGEFVLGAEASAGVVRGTYQVSRSGEEVDITLKPNGWTPLPRTLFLKFFFYAVRIFRQWPKTYLWTAKIKLGEDAPPFMESRWTRI